MKTTESQTQRDCPECRAMGSVSLGLCFECFAQFPGDGPVPITASLSWDLDLDEPLLSTVTG